MKKQFLFFAVCLGLLPIIGTYGQEGFTGPGINANTRSPGEFVTVTTAKNLPDNSWVTLQGTIVRSVGKEFPRQYRRNNH